jgi:hypothetical protein
VPKPEIDECICRQTNNASEGSCSYRSIHSRLDRRRGRSYDGQTTTTETNEEANVDVEGSGGIITRKRTRSNHRRKTRNHINSRHMLTRSVPFGAEEAIKTAFAFRGNVIFVVESSFWIPNLQSSRGRMPSPSDIIKSITSFLSSRENDFPLNAITKKNSRHNQHIDGRYTLNCGPSIRMRVLLERMFYWSGYFSKTTGRLSLFESLCIVILIRYRITTRPKIARDTRLQNEMIASLITFCWRWCFIGVGTLVKRRAGCRCLNHFV